MTTKVRLGNQNWWITTLMINGHKYCPPLTKANLHSILAGTDRYDPGLAAGHRETTGASARALHPGLRGNFLGDFLRKFRGEECPGRGRRGLQEVSQLFLEPASLRPAEQPGQRNRQTSALLPGQQLGNSFRSTSCAVMMRRRKNSEGKRMPMPQRLRLGAAT